MSFETELGSLNYGTPKLSELRALKGRLTYFYREGKLSEARDTFEFYLEFARNLKAMYRTMLNHVFENKPLDQFTLADESVFMKAGQHIVDHILTPIQAKEKNDGPVFNLLARTVGKWVQGDIRALKLIVGSGSNLEN